VLRSVHSTWLLCLSAACGGVGPTPRPAPAATGSPDRAAADVSVAGGGAELPAAFSRYHVFLRAAVGGIPAVLLFDSGAAATILSPHLVQRLGLAYRGRHVAFGIGEPITGASAYDGPEIRIGTVQLRPTAVLSWPGAAFPRYGTTAPDGVVGYDLLRSTVLLVDVAGGRVVAYDTSRARRPERQGARTVPLRVTAGLPVIDADIFVGGPPSAPVAPPASLAVVVDYGAGAGVQLSRAASERLGFPARLRDTRRRQLTGIGGTLDLSEGLTDSVRIAGRAIPNALVAADTTETPTVALADAEGLVGTEVLRRFAVTLDYARGRAVFEPNALLRAPFCRNAAGICVRTETGVRGAEVTFVDPGSAAARAGIRPGFVIVAIDGAPVAQLGVAEIDRLLDRGAGQLLEIVRSAAQLRALTRADVSQRGPLARRMPPREPVGEMIRLPAH
jgi:hypothetical protein